MSKPPRTFRPGAHRQMDVRRALIHVLGNVRQRARLHTRPPAPADSLAQPAVPLESEDAIWQRFRLGAVDREWRAGAGASNELDLEHAAGDLALMVDARPEKIEARESFYYQLELGNHPHARCASEPRGQVRVELPYDGFRHFSLDAARRLQERLAAAGAGAVEGQIGWLAIRPPLDWAGDWSCPAGADIMPVRIPLRGDGLARDELWTADEVRAAARHTYTPEALPFWPLSLEMRVRDDAWTDASLPLDSGEIGPDWPGQAALDFVATVFVPNVLANEDVQARLERLEFDWPSLAAPWQLEITRCPPAQAQQPVAWRYNPDRGVIEILDAPADRLEPAGSPLVPFCCALRLRLRAAGQALNQAEWTGAIRLRLDGALLSGRRVIWLDAGGLKRDEVVKHQTSVEAGFSVCLSDLFERRFTTVSQRWRLGAGAYPDCISDLAMALRDLGYQLEPAAQEGAANIDRLAAARLARFPNGERGVLRLQLAVEKREPGEARICARGQTRGPGSLLALDMDRLMAMLHKRFARLRDEVGGGDRDR